MGAGNFEEQPTQQEVNKDLFEAVRRVELDRATLLMTDSRADPNWRNPEHEGKTALHQACHLDDDSEREHEWEESGDTEMVAKLILFGKADPNLVDNNGDTPLHCAATYGHLKTVRWLVENGGADITIKNNRGRTAAICATRYSPKSNIDAYLNTCMPTAAELPTLKKDVHGAVASANARDATPGCERR